MSLGKTHYLVKSLIDVGWVKLDNFQASQIDKWGYAYFLTPYGYCREGGHHGAVFDQKAARISRVQRQENQPSCREEVRPATKPKAGLRV